MKVTSPTGAWTVGSTVLAPIAWGTSYVTITELLPDGRPLLIATMRVVPSGLALLIAGSLVTRWRPRGAEWWRTGMLAMFNFGIFFPLLVAAVHRLPGGVAAAVGGLQPLLVVALSWLVARRKPRAAELAVGAVAALGVGLVVIRQGADLDPAGLLAAVGANTSFAVGVVLTKRFRAPANRLAATGWQLLIAGVILVPITAIVEGTPASLTGRNVAGFAYLSMIGTAMAFVLWFNGIHRLPAAAPPLLGLAAPITGAVLGWVILGQSLSSLQLTGFVVTLAAIAYGASLPAHGAAAKSDVTPQVSAPQVSALPGQTSALTAVIGEAARAQRHRLPAANAGMTPSSVPFTIATRDGSTAVTESIPGLREGDVLEFTLRGERRTAEAMLVTDDGVVLLDLFDGDRPAWAWLTLLDDVAVFRPDATEVVTAA